MITLNPQVRRAVYDKIVSMGNFYGKYADGTYNNDDLNVVNFLKQIWDLPAMRSEDPRFRNAEADATQHLINNDDWNTSYVFERRFNLLAGEQVCFVKFVELVVSPMVRVDRTEMEEYVNAINECLKPANCELAVEDFLDGEPVYRLKEGLGHRAFPTDIAPNNIKIFVSTSPDTYPSLELCDFKWDDFGYKTRYKLYYHESPQMMRSIGTIKIMKKNADVTYGLLPNSFFSLTDEYCSLGQNLTYYRLLKSYLGNKYKEVLFALRDAACFSKIGDEFINDSVFKVSLLREQDADTALQFAQYELAGFNISDDRTFVFKAILPYSHNETLNIKFNFGKVRQEGNLNRILALIGNNGVGKTTVLSQLAKALVGNEQKMFNPQMPVFSKVIAASYSIFDDFYDVKSSSYNYVYCGMQEKHRIMNDEELAQRRRLSVEMLKKKPEGHEILRLYLDRLMDSDIVDQLYNHKGKFSEENYQKIHKWLSSGQTMLMNLIIEILANIRQNTLILIDEPEVHLHPKAITEMVHIIDSLCERYSSCCIMATHSPVVIQELLSRNVIVMDREQDGSPVIRPMRLESMGENLTTITQEIFGRSNLEPLYIKKIRELVDKYPNMDEVLQEVQNNDVPISMPMYLLLDKMFSEK